VYFVSGCYVENVEREDVEHVYTGLYGICAISGLPVYDIVYLIVLVECFRILCVGEET
jgi:hypothetical protein